MHERSFDSPGAGRMKNSWSSVISPCSVLPPGMPRIDSISGGRYSLLSRTDEEKPGAKRSITANVLGERLKQAVLAENRAGAAGLSYTAMAQSLVQIHAPANIRGRVIGLYNMAGSGMRAFSGVTVGLLGAVIGITGRSPCPRSLCSP